jgi:hypothetical protein
MDLYIYPLNDLQCSFGRQQGNIMPSLPYIPGRVVRGGLAGWAIRNKKITDTNSDEFKSLFLPDEQNSLISYPFCTSNGHLPTPLSLFELKGKPKNPRTSMIVKSCPVFAEPDEFIEKNIIDNVLDGPIDFLRRSKWCSDFDATMKPVAGTIDTYCCVDAGFSIKIDMHASHDELTGRAKKSEGLFATETMPNSLANDSLFYSGQLVLDGDNALSTVFESLIDYNFTPDSIDRSYIEEVGPDHLIFIGRRKTPAAVFCENIKIIDFDNEELPEDFIDIRSTKTIAISLTSDCIPQPNINASHVGNALELIFSEFGFTKKRSFCQKGMAHGFDIIAGKPVLPIRTLKAGSCALFEVSDTFSNDKLKDLWRLSFIGCGMHTLDGYGRFKINWPIHDINIGEVL